MGRLSAYAVPVQQKSELVTFPAPVGGLNERDALASMDPTQAVVMENWFPTSSGVMVRRGWFRWYDSIPGVVETIIKYNTSGGQEFIFAAANNSFINVTNGGVYDVVDVVKSGFLNNRWQYTQFANQFGEFTIAVNGADTPQVYNGTAWVNAAITFAPADLAAYPAMTPEKFINVTQMHRRLWFVERDSPRVWYLPVDQYQGEAQLFDCGEVFPLGGYCQICLPWSVDTGAGMDDQSIFISSKGNIAVFNGFDPDSADGFTLVGVYTVGSTIGRRCACPYGSDVLLLAENGVMALTSVLGQSKLLQQRPITDIIQHRVSQLVTQFSTEFGWDLYTNARYNQLYLNIPDPAGSYQYLMNTVLQAWCIVKGFSAICWENFYEEPVFGADTYVGRAWSGNVDDPIFTEIPEPRKRILSTSEIRILKDGSIRIINEEEGFNLHIGTSIQTKCLQAFNTFGNATQKCWSMARPVLLADSQMSVSIAFNVDYDIAEETSPLPPFTGVRGVPLWDDPGTLWDMAEWAGGSTIQKKWYGLNDIGFTGAIFLRTASAGDVMWVSTDFQLHRGGTL